MNAITILATVADTIREILAPLEIMSKGNSLRSYALRMIVNKLSEAAKTLDDLRYSDAIGSIDTLKDEIRSLQSDRDYWRDLGNRYLAEAIKNLPDPVGFPEVVDNLKRGMWINAIKEYRAATGCGLREAKDKIETIRPLYPASKPLSA